MEHAIHLAAGHFIKTVSPTSSRALLKKVKLAFENAQLGEDTVDLDVLETGLTGFSIDEGEDTNDDADDDEELAFRVGDTIGKALALVKQVIFAHN